MEAKLRQTNAKRSLMFGTLGGSHDATNEGLRILSNLIPAPSQLPGVGRRSPDPNNCVSPDLLTEISTAYSSFGEDQCHG